MPCIPRKIPRNTLYPRKRAEALLGGATHQPHGGVGGAVDADSHGGCGGGRVDYVLTHFDIDFRASSINRGRTHEVTTGKTAVGERRIARGYVEPILRSE